MTVNLADPKFKANPFPFYARLRADEPVHCVTLEDGRSAWLITRYDDVVLVLKDERFAKNPKNALTAEQLAREPWMPALFRPLQRNMLDLDPPDHTRLRALVQKAFTPQRIEQMRGRIQSLAEELLQNVDHRQSLDLIRDFALPIPTTIIAEMLGVSVADRHKFHRWSNTLVTLTPTFWGIMKAIPSVWRFLRYVRKLVRTRRASPGDDLVSDLVQAEENKEKLSEDELLAMIFLLLVAGHETTVNLIGNGMLALLEHPEQLRRLRDDPALIKSAVEELLRYSSPVETATERYTREEVTLAGTTLPRGALVFAVIASANRDERRFQNPDTLDITREPNRHLSFGLGTHFCLGTTLARLEAQIAIQTLLRRIPELQLTSAPQALHWRRGLVLRGLEALPVAIGKHPTQR
jgi:cytochrome P450 PksS